MQNYVTTVDRNKQSANQKVTVIKKEVNQIVLQIS